MRRHDIRAHGRARGLTLAALLAVAGCANDEAASRAADDGLSHCTLDEDCPTGLVCQVGVCVSPEDFLPPDVEVVEVVGRPEATASRLFTLAPEADALLALDPETLDLETVPVPPGPEVLRVVPGQETVLVLSGASRALTVVDLEGSLSIVRLPRRYRAVSVSPDGRWALLWTPDGTTPDEGAEGLVAVVDLTRLDDEPIEVAAGFRHTDVHFVAHAGVATHAVVLTKSAAVVIELEAAAEATYRPSRIPLPTAYAEVAGREVAAVPGSQVILLRGLATAALGLLDVATSTVTELALPGRATDLDLSPAGDLAVVAIRGQGQVGLLPLPEVLTSSLAARFVDVEGSSPGQVELSADGRFAAVFSASDDAERFGWLDLDSGALRVFDGIEKQVRTIALAPDARTALVVHRADPDSTVADDYERAVDADEGYSLVDLESGLAQLKRTGDAPVQAVAFGASGRWAAVTVLDPEGAHRVEAADLGRLIVDSYALASEPRFVGGLPDREQVWITQVHPAGRISLLDLEAGRLRTLTGFRLNAEITEGGR